MAINRMTDDMNIIQSLVIPGLDDDMDIIQKLDDEPNDVGGLTAQELKAEFDKAGNIIQGYINETLLPSISDTVAEADERAAAEEQRVANENARKAAEEGRVSAENTRASNENARKLAEEGRVSAEAGRVSAESARATAEGKRASAETGRVNAEQGRVSAETARASAETARASAEETRGENETTRQNNESTRRTNENGRVSAETGRVNAETGRVNAETVRVNAENTRVSAESGRVSAENARVKAEQGRAAAESTRESNETTRQSNEATRQSNEQKRVAAENARNVWENYDNEKSYVPGNKVAYNGSSYLNIAPCSGVLPSDTEHWLLIAAKGVDGEGAGDMLQSVYDPQKKAQDIFAYVDNKTAEDFEAIPAEQKGAANGVATLGSDGLLTPAQTYSLLQSISAAAAYDPSSTYSEGDYCVHEGQLYKANQDIGTAEAWTAAHWTATSIMAEIAALDYDPSGTAQSAVNTHNTSSTAHQDIRTALAAALTSEAVVSYN